MRTINVYSAAIVLPLITALALSSQDRRDETVQEDAVRQAVLDFIRAIDRLDPDGVSASFTNDATAFYPFSFTPERLDGRDAIVDAQRRGFDWARTQLAAAGQDEPYSLGLTPSDFVVRLLGPDAAVVTWHSNRPTHVGRRTSVLQRIDGTWKTVSHHASNVESDNP